MKKYIREIMLSENNGLYLCELPTGYGKTYNVVQAIRDYVKELDDDRKIIYLTTLNKNLPEDELLKAFGNDKKEYNKRVLRIRSNFDEVTEKLENLIIPEKFKTGTYEELLKVVEKYNGLIRKKAQDQEYIKVEKHKQSRISIPQRTCKTAEQ